MSSKVNDSIIAVRDVCYSFREGETRKEVLHSITAGFQRGDITILMGPSGSGKTTLLKLIGGLRTLQQGEIQVDGYRLESASKEELVKVRRKIGFIFQNHHLIASLDVVQNVMMPLSFDPSLSSSEARRRAISVLKEVGLDEHLFKKPSQLSGGQKQRVAIARAVVHNPSIILADEPTASLDGHTGREIVNHIQRLATHYGCTILLVTHDTRILDIADRLITLEDGRLREE